MDFQAIKSAPAPAHGARTFVTLDGLRGVAAIAIAFRHAPYLWQSAYPTDILQESYLAVDFFFVLSGFVLAYAYEDRFKMGMSTRQFMIARLIRLYPLYLFALIIALALASIRVIDGEIQSIALIANALYGILFIPSLLSAVALFPLNGPAWSLFFELVANFSFGLIGKRLNDILLVAIVFFAALTLVLAVSFEWLGFGTANGPMDAGLHWSSFFAGLARVAYSFFAGVLVFRLWKIRTVDFGLQPIVAVGVLSAILLAYPVASYQKMFDLCATVLVFPALVFVAACSVPGRRTARVFGWLGAISYGTYVLQRPLYGCFTRAFGDPFPAAALYFGVASVVFVVVCATLIDRYFDRPVRRALTACARGEPAFGGKHTDLVRASEKVDF
jgi:peptidoglycan/LPS O-acetylase OafA/YrhL